MFQLVNWCATQSDSVSVDWCSLRDLMSLSTLQPWLCQVHLWITAGLTQSLWLDSPAIDFRVPRYLFDNGLWRLGGCMLSVGHGLVHWCHSASMRHGTLAWRRLGGGETPGGGITVMPPCGDRHGGGWVVGRPTWEGFILSKPYVEVHFENVGPLWHCRSFCLGRLLYLKSRHRLSSHNVFFAAVIMPVAGAVQP